MIHWTAYTSSPSFVIKIPICDIYQQRKPIKQSGNLPVQLQCYSVWLQVIYYSTSIFESAGLSEKTSQYATLVTGAVNTSMTFVSALIMDRAGRRTLHLTGLGGMFIASYILTLGQIYEVSIHVANKFLCNTGKFL